MVALRTVAMVLVIVGGVALFVPSMATEQFDTERPASFSLGSGSNAAISAEQTSQVVRNPGTGNPAVAGRLINNLDTEIQMTYRVSVSDPSIEPVQERSTVRLYPGESVPITVECLPPGQEGGAGTTTVTATVESAQGGGVGIEDADFEFLVDYECDSPDRGGPADDNGGGDGRGDDGNGDDENGDEENGDDAEEEGE